MSRRANAAESTFDPVDLAVLSSRFNAIVRVRQARSFAVAAPSSSTPGEILLLHSQRSRRVDRVAESLPTHVLSGPDLMARSMREFHPTLAPGDAFLHNSPYHGNSHPADLSILMPVFDGEGAPV